MKVMKNVRLIEIVVCVDNGQNCHCDSSGEVIPLVDADIQNYTYVTMSNCCDIVSNKCSDIVSND